MNFQNLQQVDQFHWMIPSSEIEKRSDVYFFGSKPLLETMDEKVLEQISNVAKLPGLVGAAMAMPDAHWGYGFPIGGVAAFDPDQGGIISAGGVGFDISCGIRCLRTNFSWKEIEKHLEDLADVLFKVIPAGVGQGGELRVSSKELDRVMLGGARWAIEQGYGIKEDLEFIEDKGQVKGAIPDNVSDLAKSRQRDEMGSLGSGNHYLEIQVVEKIFDQTAAAAFGLFEGQVLVSIHCGSRGLGHQIGTDYLVSLAKAAHRLGIKLPDRELACAPILSKEGEQYIGAMRAASNCALANRQILTHLTREAFSRVISESHIETLFDVSHNTCKAEKHLVNGKEKLLYVHRKGATRAFGPEHPDLPDRYRKVGQPVIIGGSMGTGSYVLVGCKSEENRAFSSASHGAGRAMSRRSALKLWQGKQLINDLDKKGILIRTRSMRGAAEEAPGAYKNVDLVAEATEQAKLARRVALLRPKACVKG